MLTFQAYRVLGGLMLCLASVGCGGESFTPGANPGVDGGVDAAPDGPGKPDAAHEAGKDGAKPETGPMDAPIENAGEATVQDVVTEPACKVSFVEIEAEADAMILPEGSNCEAANTFTTSGCMNLGQSSTSRLIIRFPLGSAVDTVKNHPELTATLTMKLAGMLVECDPGLTGTATNVAAPADVFPMRSDWKEGGPKIGAQWCYRQGNGADWNVADKWHAPGANGTDDHGALLGTATPDVVKLTFEAGLTPALMLPWMTSEQKLSLLVSPAPGSAVMAFVRTREGGATPILRLSWCE